MSDRFRKAMILRNAAVAELRAAGFGRPNNFKKAARRKIRK